MQTAAFCITAHIVGVAVAIVAVSFELSTASVATLPGLAEAALAVAVLFTPGALVAGQRLVPALPA